MESVGRNLFFAIYYHAIYRSLSAWRAWVEIRKQKLKRSGTESLSAWRAWVEIADWTTTETSGKVALRMESVGRNNKPSDWTYRDWLQSLSAWRAWVEICHASAPKSIASESLSAWRAWVEILSIVGLQCISQSLSAWRAWVEIFCPILFFSLDNVALRMESVGRNILFITSGTRN